ncbi:hypothetical protein NDU88_000177 [Pleurodeles waltl]|uniref:Uncharacterized protein n=1 Tax=Pleurodeles waltl TaxID=8319 RepID=A0AAV7L644_PLEWA|nr:hypothetical protein NDU88_000177 [Pleurodeles waltl]
MAVTPDVQALPVMCALELPFRKMALFETVGCVGEVRPCEARCVAPPVPAWRYPYPSTEGGGYVSALKLGVGRGLLFLLLSLGHLLGYNPGKTAFPTDTPALTPGTPETGMSPGPGGSGMGRAVPRACLGKAPPIPSPCLRPGPEALRHPLPPVRCAPCVPHPKGPSVLGDTCM